MAYMTDPALRPQEAVGYGTEDPAPAGWANAAKGARPERALETVEQRLRSIAFDLFRLDARLSSTADRIHASGSIARLGQVTAKEGEPPVQGSLPGVLSAIDGLDEKIKALQATAERFDNI